MKIYRSGSKEERLGMNTSSCVTMFLSIHKATLTNAEARRADKEDWIIFDVLDWVAAGPALLMPRFVVATQTRPEAVDIEGYSWNIPPVHQLLRYRRCCGPSNRKRILPGEN